MASIKILNVDEIVADEPSSQIIFKGEQHDVVGLTTEAWLKFQKLQAQRQQGGNELDEFERNLEILFMIVPSLDALKPDIMRLKLSALRRLVDFAIQESGLNDQTTAVADAAAPAKETELGESMPPA